MADNESRKVVRYRVPPIEIYEITGDELELLEETSRSLSYELSFALSSLSVFVSFVIALSSASPSGWVHTVYVTVSALSLFIFVYAGFRWLRHRRKASHIVGKIRNRKMDPEASP